MGAKKAFLLPIAIASAFYTVYVVSLLVLRFSLPQKVSKSWSWVYNLLDNKSRLETAYAPIVFDTLYVLLFIFAHSFMKADIVKRCWQRLHLSSIERAIYNLTSSLCLHHLIKNWLPTQSIVFWQLDCDESKVLWWTFVVVHAVAWIVIYSGSLIMDLPELLGLKQVYYESSNLYDPLRYKAIEYRRLLSHVRHPSFLGISVILWTTNVMTLDRFIIAALFTMYMYSGWNTSSADVKYQKYQLNRKIRALRAQ